MSSKIMDTLRRISGTADTEPKTPGSPAAKSPKGNVWRSVFDPGSNPAGLGKRSYYDTVEGDPKQAPGVWDYTVESKAQTDIQAAQSEGQAAAGAAATAAGPQKTEVAGDGKYVATDQLREMLSPARVESVMRAAERTKDGKVDFQEILSALRTYPTHD